MERRGPDGRGIWLDRGIGLGHRRLAVIDPEGSAQPMQSQDGRYILTYNGELYNFRDIRAELEAQGIEFKTPGDTEVVLQALIYWGKDALQKFNGMFALGFWDKLERRLLIARDRLGIKPLYYSEKDTILAFASEFSPLLSLPWISKEPDPFGIAGFLGHFQLSFGSQTIYKDIHSIDPGHYLVCDENGSSSECYWSMPQISSREKENTWTDQNFPEAVEQFRSLFHDAVNSHLVADVPVGSFLSGGIDSSVIISLMSEITGDRVKAYSVGFAEAGFNEFKFSVPLVEELGLEHQLLRMNQDEYFPLMEELIGLKAAPLSTPNEVPMLALSNLLSKDITVVLSGEGADELLGGYGPILRSPYDFHTARVLRENPDKISPQVRRRIRESLRKQYGKIGFTNVLDHFMTAYSWLNEIDRQAVLNPDLYNATISDNIHTFWTDKLDRLKEMHLYDRYLYLLETEHLRGLLARLDATTMAASVEGRVPYCDNALIDFAWSLPFDYKLHWKDRKKVPFGLSSAEISEKHDIPKHILKQAFQDRIPEAILKRRKKAFPVPLESWLAGKYGKMAVSRITNSPIAGAYLNTRTINEWLETSLASGVGAMKVWMVLGLVMWLEGNEEE